MPNKNQLEVKVKLPEIRKKMPKTKVGGAYNDILSEAMQEILPDLISSNTKKEINASITKLNKKYKPLIKKYFEDNIAKGVDFNDIAGQDSYGVTVKKRIDVSTNRVLKDLRTKSIAAQTKIKETKANLGKDNTPQNEVQSKIDDMIGDYINNVSNSLGSNSTRLIKNETRRYRQEQWDEKHAGKECIWILGDNENHCSECIGYAGTVYESPAEAPVRPVHYHCDCSLQVTENTTKVELREIKDKAKKAKIEFKRKQ